MEATVSSLLDTVRELTSRLQASESRISALEVGRDMKPFLREIEREIVEIVLNNILFLWLFSITHAAAGCPFLCSPPSCPLPLPYPVHPCACASILTTGGDMKTSHRYFHCPFRQPANFIIIFFGLEYFGPCKVYFSASCLLGQYTL
jgi:hypothetical protein